MAYTLNLTKLINDLRGPKGLAALTEEVAKIKNEVEALTESLQPTAQKRLKEIQVRLNGLKSSWNKRHSVLEKEVEKTLGQLKKAAKDAEAKLEKALKGAKKKTAAKTSKKTTRKAAAKPAAKAQKTTKKKA